jgi:general secretion pathway protein D
MMKGWKKTGFGLAVAGMLSMAVPASVQAADCSDKLFSVTIDSQLTIGEVIDNLAETCDLTVVVADEGARKKLGEKLYYIKLKNSTLKGFLNTVLEDNDLHYTLQGNKLKISYLITKTFRVHYIAGQRIGKSHANVTIANSQNSASSTGAIGGGYGGESGNNGNSSSLSKTGISIESNDEFQFWQTVEKEIERILISAADRGMHFTKSGNGWVGPDGQVWDYNPMAPIVNPEAGMITVTGTQKQINRVARYIRSLSKQLKQQVLIDVRILAVQFDNSRTSGVDWSQLYKLQNYQVMTLRMAQKNMAEYTFDKLDGITEAKYAPNTSPKSANLIQLTSNTSVSEVVKFLGTQGDVKSISSPRVMTLNNQPALISVGRELFYKIQSASTASGGGGAVAAQGELVDSVFAGILLDITPEISPDGTITLKINPSISETIDDVKGDDATRRIPPDLIRRQIASVIKVHDGDHAILGGLITSKTGFKSNKVPLLGDIPLLGYAFKHEEKIETVEELVIIITPHIVNSEKSVSLKDLGYTKLNEK